MTWILYDNTSIPAPLLTTTYKFPLRTVEYTKNIKGFASTDSFEGHRVLSKSVSFEDHRVLRRRAYHAVEDFADFKLLSLRLYISIVDFDSTSFMTKDLVRNILDRQ